MHIKQKPGSQEVVHKHVGAASVGTKLHCIIFQLARVHVLLFLLEPKRHTTCHVTTVSPVIGQSQSWQSVLFMTTSLKRSAGKHGGTTNIRC